MLRSSDASSPPPAAGSAVPAEELAADDADDADDADADGAADAADAADAAVGTGLLFSSPGGRRKRTASGSPSWISTASKGISRWHASSGSAKKGSVSPSLPHLRPVRLPGGREAFLKRF